ncbi:MAG TPA: methyltransferase [Opitutaceae bacterium]|jgi:SAM-dependent methyltransferase
MQHASLEASFGRAADRYLKHAEVQRDLAKWLSAWLPNFRQGAALELGAGPGVLTEFILPWNGAYVATDLSTAMCTAGRGRFPSIAWHRAAAEHPPAGPWDWIFTSSMLQWVQDPVAVLDACRKVAAPGGRLLAGLFVAPTLPEWDAVVPPGDRLRSRPLYWRTESEWLAAAEQAGWRLLRIESQSRTFIYPSARAFLRSLHASGAAPHRAIPGPKLRQVLQAYDTRFRSPNVAGVADPGTCDPISPLPQAKANAPSPAHRPSGPNTPQTGVLSTWTFCRFEVSN